MLFRSQWVLSLPFKLRYRLAYDSELMRDILNIFVRAVFSELRRRARELLGLKRSQCGAVTFVQRFNSALGLNVHFHLICMDGVYAAGPDGAPEFHELPPPEDAEVLQAVTLIADSQVPDDVYEEARKQFSEAELVNLTMALVAINGANRLNIAFRTVPGSHQVRRRAAE